MAFSLTAANDPLNNQIVIFTYSGFTATATGTINPGDGNNTPITIFSSSGQIVYNYATTGTFTATAYDANANVLGTASVTVASINQRASAAMTQKGPIVETPTQAPLATQAGFTANMTAVGDRAYQAQVQGDANYRLTIGADGKANWGSGAAATDTNLYRSAVGTLTTDTALTSGGNFTANGNIATGVAGKGFQVKEGGNARQGTTALTAGAATVANTAVTATSRIYLTSQADGGAPGFLRVSARVVGTSFTITSSSGTDTSTVAWVMVEGV